MVDASEATLVVLDSEAFALSRLWCLYEIGSTPLQKLQLLTHEVAALKGVPLTGQLAQSAAVPPVHVAQLASQLSHARTCAGYLRVSPHISLHLPAPAQDRARDARASAEGRGEGQS